MARTKNFLLPRSEVLGVYSDEYFNRVTLVNNISPFAKSHCWVHQTASDIRSFDLDDDIGCSCANDIEGDIGCAQRHYVEGCLQEASAKGTTTEVTGLVTFGNTRCVACILPDAVYLFSCKPGCDENSLSPMLSLKEDDESTGRSNSNNTSSTGILCNDCKNSMEMTTPSLEETMAALEEILHDNENAHARITLMEKFPINSQEAEGKGGLMHALERAQEAAKSVGILEGLVQPEDQGNSLEETLDVKLIECCNDLANGLIESLKSEMVAICSSLVGVVKKYSQPPLKIKLRWLQHYMALEYHVEFSADLGNCFYDEISGRYSPDLEMENVVLHEIVQCSKVSVEGVESCFRLALFRLRDFLAIRKIFESKKDSDSMMHIPNDGLSSSSTDVTPFWWNYYGLSNTLGEGENATENYTLKRLTRSQSLRIHDDGASTPVTRKSRHYLDYPLVTTHCVSSDNLAHSRGTTLEVHSEHRKDLRDLNCAESCSHSINGKSTPTHSTHSLKNPLNEDSDSLSPVTASRVCFCFKCLESISTLGRYFGTRDFTEDNVISSIIFGDVSYPNGLYDGSKSDSWDEFRTTSALRKSIRAAVDASFSLGRAIIDDQCDTRNIVKQSIKVLNTALLSSLRLGDLIHSSRNSAEMKLEEIKDSVKEELYDIGEAIEDCDDVSDDSCSSESTLRDIISNSFVLSTNALHGLYSTFENDQYIQQDLDDPEDAVNLGSKSVVSRTPKRKSSSPKNRNGANNLRHSSIDSSSETSGRQSRKCTRDSLSNNDMYVYDLSERNDAASDSAVEEWYDSDGSTRGSRRQRQKQSTCSLTEIYGAQDALIPMGPLPIGVYFDASRKLWRCQWRENGKFRTKGFSLGHYESLCEARRACILFRCQVGNMPVQPEWLNPNYVQVSQLLSKRSAGTSSTASTPKKSRRKRKGHLNTLEVEPIK